MDVLFRECDGSSLGRPAMLAKVVDSIGTEQFASTLLSLLNSISGADHCAGFQFGSESIHSLWTESLQKSDSTIIYAYRYFQEGVWRKDPAISAVSDILHSTMAGLIRADIHDRSYEEIKDYVFPSVRDRVLLCRRLENSIIGVSVVRTDPGQSFSDDAVQQLAAVSNILMSSLIKHVSMLAPRPDVSTALSNLCEIERCVLSRSNLPRRESEVCARILYGISSLGISLDLGIGEESVKTYRKRAYQRLGIGCERELLRWYLASWSAWASRRDIAMDSTETCSPAVSGLQ
ncbi:helix-turn-helix transcriptional regulator [Burkholderia pseudomultivorans]|uniref:helix-turn-helix transcriptional regulator n=1 Tax=Burkholderia pseudomultivorans TaxID=1207504 RepID=UPI0028745B99|nr:helix-turn-helix transcriptional regulator [Burkholderia pseudomultivorans]MDS0859654.1 helix-turn-helix transcriptional regulator [Burkholderia pseudomultivorans]